MESIMRTKHLRYEPVFEDFNITIPKGKFTAIASANGQGKTTLIKLLSGIIPTDEMVCFEYSYAPVQDKKKYYRDVEVLLASEAPIFLFSTVYSEISFPLENLNYSKKDIKEKVETLAKELEIEEILAEHPKNLVGFNLLKVRLALAVIGEPKVLLLDDPFLFLTRDERKFLQNIFRSWTKKGITVVLTTSNLEDTTGCDEVMILNEGKIVIEGGLEEVYSHQKQLVKLGLVVPFLADLSFKLEFYELIDKIELEQEKLVDALWK